MIEPLPCPFCAADPIVEPIPGMVDKGLSGDAWGMVRCINVFCPARPAVRDGENGAEADRGSEYYKEAAVERWNDRATKLYTPDIEEPVYG